MRVRLYAVRAPTQAQAFAQQRRPVFDAVRQPVRSTVWPTPIREAGQLRKKPRGAGRGPNSPGPPARSQLNSTEEIRCCGGKLLLRHGLKMAHLGPHTTAA